MAGSRFHRYGSGKGPLIWSQTINLINSAYDGHEQISNNTWATGGAFLTNLAIIGRSSVISGAAISALHFPDVAYDQGRVVASAILTFGTQGTTGTPDATLRGQAIDNATPPSQSNLPSAFSSTTATVAVPASLPTGQHTLDVTAIVNEILARSGWERGNGINLYFTNNAGADTNSHNLRLVGHASFVETSLAIRPH